MRRSIARTYGIEETAVTFPEKKVRGYTDESIVIDTAIASGINPADAEARIARVSIVLTEVMQAGRDELARVQPPYPGVVTACAVARSILRAKSSVVKVRIMIPVSVHHVRRCSPA